MSTLTSPVTCHTFGEALDEVQWHLHAISLVELRASGATALFLQVSNDRNGGALRILENGEPSHFGDILWPHHDFSA